MGCSSAGELVLTAATMGWGFRLSWGWVGSRWRVINMGRTSRVRWVASLWPRAVLLLSFPKRWHFVHASLPQSLAWVLWVWRVRGVVGRRVVTLIVVVVRGRVPLGVLILGAPRGVSTTTNIPGMALQYYNNNQCQVND